MQLVAESIYRLGRKHHNFYAVVDGRRVTVIDAGGSRELPLLEAGLQSIGLGLNAVEAVLLTHGHSDHVGFAREVSESGVPVMAHEAEAAFLTDGSRGSQVQPMDLPLWRRQTMAFLAEMIRAGAAQEYRLRSVQTLTDGEVVDIPGKPRTLATPGHTAGHAAYILEDRRVVFSGDALVTDGLIHSATGPQMLGDVFHHDVALARASLRRFGGQSTDVLLPGHGTPWYGPIAQAVAQARAAL
ncbi:MAG TPA: MBL fold metallo-hydrolase [Acidimicrobiia bacterium]|jgi:glyoxylase-like metal-dependent hydrolase (beta-lactamase superfamily II)|nr:MBL fold metallo-hydrolase [Acidimicrobiia bacterium]